MKKVSALSVGVAAILYFMVASASAVTLNDIVGSWNVTSVTKTKVSNVGDSGGGPGIVTFTDSWEFTYEDLEGGYTYTGVFDLENGEKLTMQFDQFGFNTFLEMMTDWLLSAPIDDTLEDIVFDVDALVISPVKISKKTNGPTKGKLSAKGTVSAYIVEEDDYDTAKFSFKATITFGTKIASTVQ